MRTDTRALPQNTVKAKPELMPRRHHTHAQTVLSPSLTGRDPRQLEDDDGDVVAVVALLYLPRVGRLVDDGVAYVVDVAALDRRDDVGHGLRVQQLPHSIGGDDDGRRPGRGPG